MSERRVRLDHLLGVYRVGSGGWSWHKEYDKLIRQTDTQKLLARIRNEGIREPILLGTDGRVWDGHHRIVIAMHIGVDSVPVEFAGEEGALAAHNAEVRAGVVAEEPEYPDAVFEYRVRNDVAGFLSEPMTLSGARDEAKIDPHDFIERRRKPNEWTPVEQGADDGRS